MSSTFWMITISADNLGIVRQHNLVGLPTKRKRYSERLTQGDLIVFYVGKKRVGYGGYNASLCEFGPVATLTSSVFYDDSRIWNSRNDERYPWRWRISITSDKKINARSIIDDLSFAHGKPKWGLYFIAGVRQISENDFEVLQKALKGLKA